MAEGLRKAAVVALLPLLLAGCGIRGSLDAPASAKEKGVATSPDDADNGPGSSAPPKRHRDFPLDSLIR